MGLGFHLGTMFWFFFLLFAWVAEAESKCGVFNIEEFGAIPDGTTDSTQALLQAWKKACQWDGKGKVQIPRGTFLVGQVVLEGPCKGGLEFEVQGVVRAPSDPNEFDSDSWVAFHSVDGLTINGGGSFDGQGASSSWSRNSCDQFKQCRAPPASIGFNHITNSIIDGISSVDSKYFHIKIYDSSNINLQSLRVLAPEKSKNTDGIHIGRSNNVIISNSAISTGDDCISIGPGSSHIFISGIFCGPGHGISVGSLGKYANEEDVVGLIVRNCTLTGTTNGLRIKTFASPQASSASQLFYQDIVMNNVYNPIIIDQRYCPVRSCNNKSPSHVKISDVSFRNIRGTSASKDAVHLFCSEAVPCQNVQLHDIKLKYQGEGSSTSLCSNAYGNSSGEQVPPSCL
ncbi:exopolygalacturonase-like [Tasmannia lanceolata]|uniref:exopolygalacturonase-like n=1 Tax=Tasmannia lanceolata TaxID=3420 RepID=UPI0040640777